MLKTLPYYGGKARAGVNRWIRSLLPTDRRLYVEPSRGGTGSDERKCFGAISGRLRRRRR